MCVTRLLLYYYLIFDCVVECCPLLCLLLLFLPYIGLFFAEAHASRVVSVYINMCMQERVYVTFFYESKRTSAM